MSRILRTALMWLLALALPLQGVAAASMFGGGSGPSSSAAVHSHAQAMHKVEHHPHAGAADHGAAHKSGAGATHSKASCSACASCCTSAALPTTPVVFEATHVPDTFVRLAPHRVASFISGGPERPPRSILA